MTRSRALIYRPILRRDLKSVIREAIRGRSRPLALISIMGGILMKPALFEWLLIPFVLWGVFQGLLYFHANQVHLALNLAAFEGSKEAALHGRYDEAIYDNMKGYLVKMYHYDPAKIEITGTEKLTLRGNDLTVTIKVPKPRMDVIPLFASHDSNSYFIEKKTIMSEYIP